jgi:hypothetical protein
MKDNRNFFERIFSSFFPALVGGSGKLPVLRSNIYRGTHSAGYGKIGGSMNGKLFQSFDHRKSPLLGNATPSRLLSGYFERIDESRQYELLDISRLSVQFFSDCVKNFIDRSATELITVQDPETQTVNTQVSDRINDILNKQLRWVQYIETHLNSEIYYGAYYSMLKTGRDEKGHVNFRILPLVDPNAVVIKKTIKEDEDENEIYVVRGKDDTVYEVPYEECFSLGTPDMRLENDLKSDQDKAKEKGILPDHKMPWDNDKKLKYGTKENRKKVIESEYYIAATPLYYSSLLKLKELVVKELMIGLLGLRDLSTPSILALMFDKGTALETAQELCTKVQRLLNQKASLSSFLSAQFDATSLIESTLSNTNIVIPDFNATIQNKGVISVDKLSDKQLELMQTVDQSRANVLGTVGLPSSILDSTSGNKWQVLAASEKANSRVNALLGSIKDSTVNLVCKIYKIIYKEELDPSLVKVHFVGKSTVEYNNSLNTIENVSSLVQGISNILTTALQTLESTVPLVDPKTFIGYIQKMIKDADPDAGELINEDSIQNYLKLMQQKVRAIYEQQGLDVDSLDIDFTGEAAAAKRNEKDPNKLM